MTELFKAETNVISKYISEHVEHVQKYFPSKDDNGCYEIFTPCVGQDYWGKNNVRVLVVGRDTNDGHGHKLDFLKGFSGENFLSLQQSRQHAYDEASKGWGTQFWNRAGEFCKELGKDEEKFTKSSAWSNLFKIHKSKARKVFYPTGQKEYLESLAQLFSLELELLKPRYVLVMAGKQGNVVLEKALRGFKPTSNFGVTLNFKEKEDVFWITRVHPAATCHWCKDDWEKWIKGLGQPTKGSQA